MKKRRKEERNKEGRKERGVSRKEGLKPCCKGKKEVKKG